MKINSTNYEAFALDYLEGNLPPATLVAMEQFLAENLEIAKELEGLREIALVPDEDIIYTNKEGLKKSGIMVIPVWRRTGFRVLLAAAAVTGIFFIGNHLYEEEKTVTVPVVVEEKVIAPKIDANPEEEEAVAENVVSALEKEVETTPKPKKSTIAKPNQVARINFSNKNNQFINSTPESLAKGLNERPKTLDPKPENNIKEAIQKMVEPMPEQPVLEDNIVTTPKQTVPEATPNPSPQTEEPVVVEKPEPPSAAQPEKEAAPIAESATKKRRLRVAFFPKLKDRFSNGNLRKVLLPEAITEESR